YAVCHRSSMLSASRPRQNGSRYSSTAVFTGSGRWLKVAQPRPYRPGSLVSTFTTTKRILGCGEVRIARTLVIFSGPSFLVAGTDFCAQALPPIPARPRNVLAALRPVPLSISRLFMVLLESRGLFGGGKGCF